MKETHYSDNDIQVLEGLEAVRKRPGMYIGSTGERGLHQLEMMVVVYLRVLIKKQVYQQLKLYLLYFMLEVNLVVKDIKFLVDFMVLGLV